MFSWEYFHHDAGICYCVVQLQQKLLAECRYVASVVDTINDYPVIVTT